MGTRDKACVAVGWLRILTIVVLPLTSSGTLQWGYSTNNGGEQCSGGGAMAGICTSGGSSSNSECSGQRYGHGCSSDFALTDSVHRGNSGRGEWLDCRDNEIQSGLCASAGTDGDCSGGKFNDLWCSSISNGMTLDNNNRRYKCCGKGDKCECDSGYYVTGFCGSAGDHRCGKSGPCHGKCGASGYGPCRHNGANEVFTGLECRKAYCRAGFDKSNKCQPCVAGKFSNQDSSCEICQPGSYSSQPGSASCDACPPGTSQSSSPW